MKGQQRKIPEYGREKFGIKSTAKTISNPCSSSRGELPINSP